MNNEQVMQLMADNGMHEGGMDNWVIDNAWFKFANLVEAAARADEREKCAKVIELHAGIIDTPNAFIGGPSNFAKMKARDLADSIRDRKTT